MVWDLCSQHLFKEISELLSALEDNRAFHFMQEEDDMEDQGIDEKARSVYKNLLLQLGLTLAEF